MPDTDPLAGLLELPPEQHPYGVVYAGQMAEIRDRVSAVRSALTQIESSQDQHPWNIDMIFLHFRKCTELITLGTLVANRHLYAIHHKAFANGRKLAKTINLLRKHNPDFYPVPVAPPVLTGPRSIYVGPFCGDYLKVEDLFKLYDVSSRIVHTPNPFSKADHEVHIRYPIAEWAARIESLLRWHYITQAAQWRWLVHVPTEGKVKVYPSQPV